MTVTKKTSFDAIVRGEHRDPFSVLGPHAGPEEWRVRSFQPRAQGVDVVDEQGGVLAACERAHDSGLYEARLPLPMVRYRLRLHENGHLRVIEDPYRFDSQLGELDRHLFAEGAHERLYDKLGAHLMEVDDVHGVHFAVWAPNARRVSVIGSFNHWDGRYHVMRLHPGNGVWDIFIPEVSEGAHYKFELLGPDAGLLPFKADPFARCMEPPPGNASIVYTSEYRWQDEEWMAARPAQTALDQPVTIYEVHLGSWRRHGDGDRWFSYRELAESLVPYVRDMGYTHIELLPVSEHPFDGSWGYQPIGLFAPTWRFGGPDDFKFFIDCCHLNGVGVIADWVPAHFPRDEHGLGMFDGTSLYEHADPRQGVHQDWDTLVFNFGRNEVVNYLLANALFWLEEYHLDALRVDAVASMLYLDYSREPGDWVPNQYGGNENLEAVAFLRHLNKLVHAKNGVTMAEESTAWPMVSRPTYIGGLGFTYKWNMGWMHDTLHYIEEDPVHRRYHHDKLTFGLLYAFHENFVLSLSHDEVVHGKGSLLARMPGDTWQKFANLRVYFTFMYGHPGKKLVFMGGEFGQGREWNHAASLDWHLLNNHWHAGVRNSVRDLNRLYRKTPALYEVDVDASGFEWIDCTNYDESVVAFVRRAKDPANIVLVVCNFTPVVRHDHRIGVPIPGVYREVFNSDAHAYGGSGVGNLGAVTAEPIGSHGYPYSVNLALPPLAGLILQPADAEQAK
ncbi:MAG: 1,4-alpha-glucan branching protein GlgB [Gammaproteobacteria bacterium]|nr:1,4-alpha-glucan branching protein GlgB [Gammaproteobacteria bacterium]